MKATVLKADIIKVIHPATRSLDTHSCIYIRGHAKQHQHLVEHMRAKIIKYTCARCSLLFPCIGLYVVSESIIMQLELNNTAYELVFNNLFDREKIAIPSPVLKYREHFTRLFCQRDELICLFCRD